MVFMKRATTNQGNATMTKTETIKRGYTTIKVNPDSSMVSVTVICPVPFAFKYIRDSIKSFAAEMDAMPVFVSRVVAGRKVTITYELVFN